MKTAGPSPTGVLDGWGCLFLTYPFPSPAKVISSYPGSVRISIFQPRQHRTTGSSKTHSDEKPSCWLLPMLARREKR